MLTATIRPVETRTIETAGPSGEAIRDAVTAQLPDGWVIDRMPLKLDAKTQGFTSTVTIVRRDGIQTIQADDMDSLTALVPEGWQMLFVQRND